VPRSGGALWFIERPLGNAESVALIRVAPDVVMYAREPAI
jgi:hypothetical protein